MSKLIKMAAIMALSGCQEDSEMLTAQQLVKLFSVDQKISFSRFHLVGTAYIHKDKTFEVNIPALGTDKGVWWLEADKVCSRWEQVNAGEQICAIIGQYPDGSYKGLSASSGIHLGNFQFIPID